ncbi:MAG: DUF4138 domain-containing protein [Paludibacteraceae bacterium]|nr:DUF4138 domain-containing protein [Paludibacteraceae bacterium]
MVLARVVKSLWYAIFLLVLSCPLYAQERIKGFDVIELGVSDVKWVYLKFKSDISNIDHGTDDIQIERTSVSSIARIRSRVPRFVETHVTFITKDGEVHTFHVHYEQNPGVVAANVRGKTLGEEDVIRPLKVELSDDRTSHITFPHKVVDMSVGCDSAIIDHVPNTDNMVMAKCYPYDTNLFKETSLTVVTEDKNIYAFDVVYKEVPEVLNFSVDDADKRGTVFSVINVNETDMRTLGELVISKGAQMNRGIMDGKMTFALQGIFIKDDVAMFHLAIANGSQIDYDIDFIKCYITNRKNLKKQAMQIDDITPLYEFVQNDKSLFVPANSTYHTVLFFKRFTIPDKHNLFFEVFEKNGGRHLQFTISNHDLLSAKVLK